MKHLHYDSSILLVSNDVADAVIEYAAALAGGDRADTVRVPAIAEDGTITTTKILIGPSSEIVIARLRARGSVTPRSARTPGLVRVCQTPSRYGAVGFDAMVLTKPAR